MSARPATVPMPRGTPELDTRLAEGSSYSNVGQAAPLKRTVCVSIKATLNELASQTNAGKWSPSPEALKSIFQQMQYTDLNGASSRDGDLSSTVLHQVAAQKVKSSFPCAVGCNITGVDQKTYGLTGAAFSTIILPNEQSVATTVLQEDDPELAHDFMKSYPGYSVQNIETKGIHSVAERGFFLVDKKHPLMTAISDNADQLQVDQVSPMPEGLVKITSQLYNAVLPVVKTQVESQVRVRDYSRASVNIMPADSASWQECMEGLVVAETRPLRAEREHALRGKTDATEVARIKADFAKKEAEASSRVQNTPHELHLMLSHTYNFMSSEA